MNFYLEPPAPTAPGLVILPSMWHEVDCEELKYHKLVNTLWTVIGEKLFALGTIQTPIKWDLPISNRSARSYLQQQWMGWDGKYFTKLGFKLISSANQVRLIQHQQQIIIASQFNSNSKWKSNLSYLVDGQSGYLPHGVYLENILMTGYQCHFYEEKFIEMEVTFGETSDVHVQLFKNKNGQFDETQNPQVDNIYGLKVMP